MKPKALSTEEVYQTVDDFVRCAALAQSAGYDGVEIMGSEGYLLNEFIAARTNQRDDEWGGSYQNRIRFPVDIVRRTREKVGKTFIIIYRLSMLDLVEGGSSLDEVIELAQAIEAAGASIINTGIGWHEARIPTIATKVPRAAWAWVTKQLKGKVGIPLVATNRINTPEVAEQLLADGFCDMISMARPFLADPLFMQKAASGKADEINTCIGCNQGCFDPIFEGKPQTCLVNPRAGAEGKLAIVPAPRKKKVMIIGGGPAGMEAARVAALRGHDVCLYEKQEKLGGQIPLAAVPPGRREFSTFVAYLEKQLEKLNVRVHSRTEAGPEQVDAERPDAVIVATGAEPWAPEIPGAGLPGVVWAWDVLSGKADTGKRVVVIGGGAVGLETAIFLARKGTIDAETLHFLAFNNAESFETLRELLYRGIKTVTVVEMLGKVGRDIGTSTRWTVLQDLSRLGVRALTNTSAREITGEGVWVEREGKKNFMPADTVVLATGAKPVDAFYPKIKHLAPEVYLIGDAKSPRKALEAVAEGFEIGRTI
jgi:2,4-dienoyl-CoA reductase (NADPH2)